jgi:hypothetical protein
MEFVDQSRTSCTLVLAHAAVPACPPNQEGPLQYPRGVLKNGPYFVLDSLVIVTKVPPQKLPADIASKQLGAIFEHSNRFCCGLLELILPLHPEVLGRTEDDINSGAGAKKQRQKQDEPGAVGCHLGSEKIDTEIASHRSIPLPVSQNARVRRLCRHYMDNDRHRSRVRDDPRPGAV